MCARPLRTTADDRGRGRPRHKALGAPLAPKPPLLLGPTLRKSQSLKRTGTARDGTDFKQRDFSVPLTLVVFPLHIRVNWSQKEGRSTDVYPHLLSTSKRSWKTRRAESGPPWAPCHAACFWEHPPPLYQSGAEPGSPHDSTWVTSLGPVINRPCCLAPRPT